MWFNSAFKGLISAVFVKVFCISFAVRFTRQTNLTEETAWETDSGSACQGIPNIWLNRMVQLPCPAEPAIEINCLFTPITHTIHTSILIHHADNSLCHPSMHKFKSLTCRVYVLDLRHTVSIYTHMHIRFGISVCETLQIVSLCGSGWHTDTVSGTYFSLITLSLRTGTC